jgi:GNAT superfamily N-acetyltransferase
VGAVTRSGPSAAALAYRPARPDELAACAGIWRTAINDYTVPMGQAEIPAEINPTTRLFTHLRSTDPDRFVVATVPDAGGERIVAFASAIMRDRLWYLSMLFVLPEFQGAGLGRELLTRVLPTDASAVRSTATDSAQPISNALYAMYDIVPRMPLFSVTGLPQRPEAFGAMPSGIVALPFDEIAAGPPDGQADGLGHRLLVEAIDALDRDLLGVAHPLDHRSCEPSRGTAGHADGRHARRVRLCGGPAASGRSPCATGAAGPVRHLTSAVVPRGAFALWIGGAADRALVPALQAGFRLDRYPVLLCWDRAFADFSRYLPISPGLL